MTAQQDPSIARLAGTPATSPSRHGARIRRGSCGSAGGRGDSTRANQSTATCVTPWPSVSTSRSISISQGRPTVSSPVADHMSVRRSDRQWAFVARRPLPECQAPSYEPTGSRAFDRANWFALAGLDLVVSVPLSPGGSEPQHLRRLSGGAGDMASAPMPCGLDPLRKRRFLTVRPHSNPTAIEFLASALRRRQRRWGNRPPFEGFATAMCRLGNPPSDAACRLLHGPYAVSHCKRWIA